MSAFTIAAIVFVAAMVLIFIRGHRVLEKRKQYIASMARDERKEIREVSYVSYHGGLPELEKPQKLTLALADDAMMLVTNQGERASLPMERWLSLERFTTRRKHDMKQRSMVLWGPFNNIMFKDQIRHFIVVNYRDKANSDGDNHILIELGTPDERDRVFTEMEGALGNYRRSGLLSGRDRRPEEAMPVAS